MAEADLLTRLAGVEPFPAEGRICAIGAGYIEALGPDLPMGTHCRLVSSRTGQIVADARIVGLRDDRARLVPFGPLTSLRVGDVVRGADRQAGAAVGAGYAGRAVDALGRPIDGAGGIDRSAAASATPLVMDRVAPHRPFPTGIRAIDGLLTLGFGARMGVFSASGVGKTRLVEQILRQAQCDRIIVCLVGERGREVEALWRQIKASRRRAHTSLVAATSDESAVMRVQAVEQALSLAEFWRDQGENVLLLLDSATRLAMAMREIGLVAGEPPTVRAYTPGVFQELPRIVERCGAVRQGGSITAIFTVLSENDEVDDPIVEVMKSLLDGHIVLSRRLAQMGHFPAIDIARSISRLFDGLADGPQRVAAAHCRAMIARHDEARILIESGMYRSGGDRDLDAAINAQPRINAFLRQDDNAESWSGMTAQLIELGKAGA
ncbi:FliI/YscN family ATPase [Telmatospirillum sp.]|uniref:FliI/YscN family ATPase n=1 Tax=Telmatospirillum sp. TaxID=2079197 RepID=UPI0028422A43|nr:FliI/YscN family ATPase [Telmatospirillum sp.]MDR3438088.1 FliI/YscN family ATPase [Telmatospirillum sp.]